MHKLRLSLSAHVPTNVQLVEYHVLILLSPYTYGGIASLSNSNSTLIVQEILTALYNTKVDCEGGIRDSLYIERVYNVITSLTVRLVLTEEISYHNSQLISLHSCFCSAWLWRSHPVWPSNIQHPTHPKAR